MPKYIISYDLKTSGTKEREYDELENRLENLGARRLMQSFWRVKLPEHDTDKVRDQLRTILSGILQLGDHVWVVKVQVISRVWPIGKS